MFLQESNAILTVEDGAELDVLGGDFQMTGGTTTIGHNGSTINVTSSYTQSGGITTVGRIGGRLVVTGTVLLTGGNIAMQDLSHIIAGNGVQVQTGTTLGMSAGGNGLIEGNVTNSGTINVDNGTFTGVLMINGNYTQSGTLNMGIAGNTSYDVLDVTRGNVRAYGLQPTQISVEHGHEESMFTFPQKRPRRKMTPPLATPQIHTIDISMSISDTGMSLQEAARLRHSLFRAISINPSISMSSWCVRPGVTWDSGAHSM